MTRNLISLVTLDANGYRYSAENGVLNVMKGAMVLMKGSRQRSLYFLQGTTVIGLGAICTTSAVYTTSADIDSTKLWHM